MAVSQNGWSVLNTAPATKLRWITGRVRDGDVAKIFDWLGEQFDYRVEKIRPADSWGWAVRNISGSSSISNHASGTAVDFNATTHPLAASGTFSKAQVQVIHELLAALDGVVRWGGDYSGRKDEMHFEINATAAKVAAVAKKLPSITVPSNPPSGANNLQVGSKGEQVKSLQEQMNAIFPAYSKLKVDGIFGDATKQVIIEFQARSGLKEDGIVGNATKTELLKHGIRI